MKCPDCGGRRRIRRWSRNPVNKDVLRKLPKLQELDPETSEAIINIVDATDPTPTGYYAHWILRDVLSGKIGEDDASKVRGWIKDYLDLSKANKAIMQDYPLSKKRGIKDSTQLFQFLQDRLPDKYSLEMIPHQGGSRGGSKLAGVTEYGGIPAPFRILKVEGDNDTARRSLMKLGKGTAWCTGISAENGYASAKHYLAENPVIIILAFHKPYVQAHIGLEQGLQIKNVEDAEMEAWGEDEVYDDFGNKVPWPEAPKFARDLGDPNKEQITGLLKRIKFFKRAFTFYEKKLTSSSTKVVDYAINGLGRLGDPAAVPSLINLLRVKYWKKLITGRHTPEEWERSGLVKVRGGGAGGGARRIRQRRGLAPGPLRIIMRDIFSALMAIGDPSAIPALKEVLSPELGVITQLDNVRPALRDKLQQIIRKLRRDALWSMIHLGSTNLLIGGQRGREELSEILPSALKVVEHTQIDVAGILVTVLDREGQIGLSDFPVLPHEYDDEEASEREALKPERRAASKNIEWFLKNDPTVIPLLIDKLNQETAILSTLRPRPRGQESLRSRKQQAARSQSSIIDLLGYLRNPSAIAVLLRLLPWGVKPAHPSSPIRPGSPVNPAARTWKVIGAMANICNDRENRFKPVCNQVIENLNHSLILIYDPMSSDLFDDPLDPVEVFSGYEERFDVVDRIIYVLGDLRDLSSVPALLHTLKKSKEELLAKTVTGGGKLTVRLDPETGEPLLTKRMLISQILLEGGIAATFGKIGDPSLIPLIYDILITPPLRVEARTTPVRGLATYTSAVFEAYMEKQRSCIQAIKMIGGPAAAQALSKFIDHWESPVPPDEGDQYKRREEINLRESALEIVSQIAEGDKRVGGYVFDFKSRRNPDDLSIVEWSPGGRPASSGKEHVLYAVTPSQRRRLRHCCGGTHHGGDEDCRISAWQKPMARPPDAEGYLFFREVGHDTIQVTTIYVNFPRLGTGTLLWDELIRRYPDHRFPPSGDLRPPGKAMRDSLKRRYGDSFRENLMRRLRR